MLIQALNTAIFKAVQLIVPRSLRFISFFFPLNLRLFLSILHTILIRLMMTLLVPLFTSTDLTEEAEREHQAILMRAFFADCDPDFLAHISHGDPTSNVCGDQPWTNVVCVGWVVDGIWMSKAAPGALRLFYAPHTIKTLCIPFNAQRYALETRHFPRNLRHADLTGNEIYGTMDLTVMPQEIRCLLAPYNRISGPVNLMRLPRKLEKLDLSANSISQHTVYYFDLPETIERINLLGNSITAIDTFDEKPHPMRKLIFRGMDKRIVE